MIIVFIVSYLQKENPSVTFIMNLQQDDIQNQIPTTYELSHQN